MTTTAALVAGLGSAHGDDQAGWLAVDHLNVLLSEGSGSRIRVDARRISSPIDLLTLLPEYPRVLICDAVQCSPAAASPDCLRIELPQPWTAQSLADCFTPATSPRTGTHGIGLFDVLQIAQFQLPLSSRTPRVTLYAIPASDFSALALPSPATIEFAHRAADHMLRELAVSCDAAI
jgi:hypothetical protein